jgi:hypothetical protein
MTANTQSEGKKPVFFCFHETDYICHYFTHIVPCNDVVHLVCDDQRYAEWENGSPSCHRSDMFH